MGHRRRVISKTATTTLSLFVALVIGEVFLRYYFNVVTYERTAAVDRIQRHLRPKPDIGFAWEPNVSYDERIVLAWADQDKELAILCTDSWGFRNHPKASADRRAGRPVDVVGVGDSFVEMAARPFYEYFAQRSLRYHSFAMHRQCTPQYNIILSRYALPLKPRFVLYGVFENDFFELADYEAWRASGMDWFTYHSGYWCGPAYTESRFWRPKGYLALYQGILPARYRKRRVQYIVDYALQHTCDDIAKAQKMCAAAEARLLVLLIPGRRTLFHGLEYTVKCYDHIATEMRRRDVAVMDLRPVILSHPEPRSLYYRKDGHWNLRGMRLVASAVYRRLMYMKPSARPTTRQTGSGTSRPGPTTRRPRPLPSQMPTG